MAPTTAIETVLVVRPLKVTAFACGFVATFLLIVSISVTAWLTTDDVRRGLWSVCDRGPNNTVNCTPINLEVFEDGILSMADQIVPGWYLGVAILMTSGLVIGLIATILCGVGLLSSSIDRKYKYYRSSMYIMILAVIALVTGLIVLPVMFSKRINIEESDWYFAWAYGVAWGGTIFQIGHAVLLYIDKETEEIFFEEKTYYHDNEAAD